MTTRRFLCLTTALSALLIGASQTPAPAQVLGINLLRATAIAQSTDTQVSEKNGGRTVVTTTTEKDANGKVTRVSTRTDEYDKPKGDPDRKVTKSTETDEEYEKGKVKKTTTKTSEYKESSTKVTEKVKDKDGERTTSEEEKDKLGQPIKTTEYDDKGHKTKTTEYDPPGKPFHEDEYDEKGKLKKSTDYGPDGKPKRVTEYEKGKKKTETTYGDDGKPTKKTEYDGKGKVTKEETFASTAPHTFLPGSIVPGETFSFTVATLQGEVVPNQKVTIDGGPNGIVEATTDLNGIVVAKAPDNWKAARVAMGGAVIAMLANRMSGGGKPTINDGPEFAQPGSIIDISGAGFAGDLTNASVKIGGRSARILAASPTSLKVQVPNDLTLGRTKLTYSDTSSSTHMEDLVFTFTAVKLEWEKSENKMTTGQKSTKWLNVKGTEEKVSVNISDVAGDSVTVNNSGKQTSSGGPNNRIPVQLTATGVGGFNVRATLPKAGETDYEKDQKNAETSRRDAAGWRDSAEAEDNADVASAKRIAAQNSDRAAKNWDAAAEARKHGNDKKAEALEKAAKCFDEAAKAYGSDRDPGKGKAAADEGKAYEEKARTGG